MPVDLEDSARRRCLPLNTVRNAIGLAKLSADVNQTFGSPAAGLYRVLSDRNRALLGIIAPSGPESLTRLAELTGRKESNLSRTLKTMERYGFVQLSHGARGSIIPKVPDQTISLTLPLSKAGLQGIEAA